MKPNPSLAKTAQSFLREESQAVQLQSNHYIGGSARSCNPVDSTLIYLIQLVDASRQFSKNQITVQLHTSHPIDKSARGIAKSYMLLAVTKTL